MNKWPKLREGLIDLWHRTLDYDRKIPEAKREKSRVERENAKKSRLVADAEKDSARRAKDYLRAAEASVVKEIEAVSITPIPRPPRRAMGSCPACGCQMKKRSKATDSGSGCLVLIVGLVLTPILIGIPLILVGLHYMSKREGFWRCPHCGMETGRDIGFFEITR